MVEQCDKNFNNFIHYSFKQTYLIKLELRETNKQNEMKQKIKETI